MKDGNYLKDTIKHYGFNRGIIMIRKWNKQSIIEEIQTMPLSDLNTKSIRKINNSLYNAALIQFTSWRNALTMAGFDYNDIIRERDYCYNYGARSLCYAPNKRVRRLATTKDLRKYVYSKSLKNKTIYKDGTGFFIQDSSKRAILLHEIKCSNCDQDALITHQMNIYYNNRYGPNNHKCGCCMHSRKKWTQETLLDAIEKLAPNRRTYSLMLKDKTVRLYHAGRKMFGSWDKAVKLCDQRWANRLNTKSDKVFSKTNKVLNKETKMGRQITFSNEQFQKTRLMAWDKPKLLHFINKLKPSQRNWTFLSKDGKLKLYHSASKHFGSWEIALNALPEYQKHLKDFNDDLTSEWEKHLTNSPQSIAEKELQEIARRTKPKESHKNIYNSDISDLVAKTTTWEYKDDPNTGWTAKEKYDLNILQNGNKIKRTNEDITKDNQDDPSCLLSTAEISKHLGLNYKTVYRCIKENDMPAYKVGPLWRFKLNEVNEWINNRHSLSTAEILGVKQISVPKKEKEISHTKVSDAVEQKVEIYDAMLKHVDDRDGRHDLFSRQFNKMAAVMNEYSKSFSLNGRVLSLPGAAADVDLGRMMFHFSGITEFLYFEREARVTRIIKAMTNKWNKILKGYTKFVLHENQDIMESKYTNIALANLDLECTMTEDLMDNCIEIVKNGLIGREYMGLLINTSTRGPRGMTIDDRDRLWHLFLDKLNSTVVYNSERQSYNSGQSGCNMALFAAVITK